MAAPVGEAVESAAATPTAEALAAVARRGDPVVEGTGPLPTARAQLATFLDLSAQMFCIADLTGTLVWWNPSFEHTLGYGPEDLLNARLDELVHPDDKEAYKAAEAVLAENGEAGPTQVRFLTRSGEWRWLEWTTRVDLSRRRVYGAARDITDRRRDEVDLSESEARLRAIVKYSTSVIFVKGLDGRYLLVNDEFCRVTGVPMAEARSSRTGSPSSATSPCRPSRASGSSWSAGSCFVTTRASPTPSVGSPRTPQTAAARRRRWRPVTASSTLSSEPART
jgi:PAS domain S-box-containing protein